MREAQQRASEAAAHGDSSTAPCGPILKLCETECDANAEAVVITSGRKQIRTVSEETKLESRRSAGGSWFQRI